MDFEEQYKRVFRYCSSHINDPETAEDLTQETFLRFLEHPEYQNSGKEVQYLYTIARHLCIDEYRKKGRTEEPIAELPETAVQETDWLDRMMLRTILEELPEEEREIITLRYISELSVADIAKLYQTTWFAMNRRIKRILNTMRKSFEKEGSE